MDIVDLLARELQSRRIKSTDAFGVLALLTLNTIAWILILDVLNEVIHAEQANFSGLQFLGFAAGYLAFLITSLVSKKKVIDLFEDLLFNIRYRLIQHMRRMELKPFEEIGSGTFFNVMTLDLRYISDIAEVLSYLLSQAIMVLGILLYMASLSIPVFTIILMILIVGSLAFLFIQHVLTREVEITRIKEDSLFNVIEGLLFGFKELKLNRAKNEDFFQRAIKPNILDVCELRKGVGYIHGEATILAQVIWSMMLLFVVFILPDLNMVSADTFFSLVTAVLLMPFVYLLNDLNSIAFANISIDRIFRFEERLASSLVPVAPTPESVIRSQRITKLAYKDLRFNYTDEQGKTTFSIGPMDLSFASGEIIFIIGNNGSGKSTLLKLITGLYPPLSGTVTLDGEEIESGGQRGQFSSVFSDFHLFDRFYGLKNVDEQMVTALIRLMGMEHKVSYREKGFSTINLSTGQKKRLALIVAILEDKPFYVFDEWSADQSPEFREYFYKILLPDLKAKNKLVICITHDDNYYHLADRIYRLDQGKSMPFTETRD
uniref:Putative ATP-binding cassette transporter n=1 Tax=Candidatus Kentrum sp. FM TaxID=2126340 RepID=A0A450VQ51_9GAMM|nr:MAG: putative ATP-binding cassette transporter [Candidatus Kentron sp. FM]VFJ57611.1 MAG: putative ATP-binding cassette transporter [Candidatus Kentron sp. FM]VFK06907.1 MAG: putative ATP-binding cassette transporter [Candidatus Kentron sp. FM]